MGRSGVLGLARSESIGDQCAPWGANLAFRRQTRRMAKVGTDWELVEHRPPAPLESIVQSCHGYWQDGAEPGRHRGLPSPTLTLIVTIDQPLELESHPDPAQPADRYPTLVGGLHTRPAIVRHDGRQHGIQLGLGPLGARLLFGVPAGELAGLDLNADQVLGQVAAELHDRVAEAADWPQRFAALDLVLGRLVAARQTRGGAVSRTVGYAWNRLLRGGTSVRELADELGWSQRHLASRFGQEIGLSPRAAVKVVRFDRARRALADRVTDGAPADLAGLAADHGYYDQAHLARDFRELAGCSPSRWLAEEFRIVQAPDDGHRAGCSA